MTGIFGKYLLSAVAALVVGWGLAGPAPAKELTHATLENGLKVILKEEHKAPVVSVQVWYRVGSRNEVGGKTGLSHLLEHMMFKGTDRYGKGEYSRTVAKYGGNENAFTSRDYTAYYMTWAPEHLPLSLDLEGDRMTGLLLDEAEFNTEREVVREERRLRIDDNPIYDTVEQLYATAFLAYPYRQPVIGWMSDLEGLTRDDARAHYRRFYNPANATLVVVGDFDSDDLLERVKNTLGAIPAGEVPDSAVSREPEQRGERRVTLSREARLPFLILGYHAPNWESPDAYPLIVLSRILFEGKSSRIYQRLIYGDRIAVDAGGSYDPLTVGPELFYFHATMAPGHTAREAETAIYEEVARLQAEAPTEKELARARNQVEASYLMAQDSVFYQAMKLGEAETVGAGVDYVDRFPERIRAVTGEDVLRVAAKYLTPNTRTVAELLPKTGEKGAEDGS